ncbi:MAG: hypothetical protein K2L11_01885 [Muribaculaceae bacterium]|nr:hypothetical protein [Muribaculaceae bacterium]
MDDKLFIIAIGGTGMRCLESFVHLCAAGMFDNKTIEILTLDTDQANGNKGRVEGLIDLYNRLKTSDPQNPGGTSTANTLFSAKLNLYRFFTEYSDSERSTFQALSLGRTRGLTPEQMENDKELADLFFDHNSVQEFNLSHGYRAQTHLGSFLMYHGIIESAIKTKRGGADVKEHDRDLQEFLQLLNSSAANARVFVFGSVFGGTGASSIPVIPVALRDALKILTGGNNELNLNKVKFGSTLLTDYFRFDAPDDRQKDSAKIIADSTNFALNSQAALGFYVNDPTVKQSYKMLYHIGWPGNLKIDYSKDRHGDVITGGKDQSNPCHVVELMSAAAAYDFFKRDDLSKPQAEYVFRSVESTDGDKLRLTGASFVGDREGTMFEHKLGTMLSLAHLMLSQYKGAEEGTDGTIEFLKDIESRNVDTYSGIPDEQARLLDAYLKQYAYSIQDGQLAPGWLHQVKSTIDGSFIFSDDALSLVQTDLQNVDPGGIYRDDKYNWQTAGIPIGKKAPKRFDKFIEVLKSDASAPSSQQGTSLKERFIGHIYNAIRNTQKESHLNS